MNKDEDCNYNGSVKDVITQLRQEISFQSLDSTICNELLVDNVNMILELINDIDNLEDNTQICVKYNPMGCLYYEIAKRWKNND